MNDATSFIIAVIIIMVKAGTGLRAWTKMKFEGKGGGEVLVYIRKGFYFTIISVQYIFNCN